MENLVDPQAAIMPFKTKSKCKGIFNGVEPFSTPTILNFLSLLIL